MELKAKKREVLGKKVKQLRREGFIPAELFGKGVGNEHVSVSEKEFAKAYRTAGTHELVTLAVEGGKKTPVLIADAVRDPLSQIFISADFHAVRMDEKIRVSIPLSFTGEAPATKQGLPVIKVMDEIEVETLPGKAPHSFAVDLSALTDQGMSIHVKDLEIPKDVKIFLEPDAVIATIGEKAKEEEAPAPAAAETPADAAPATDAPNEEKK